MIRSSSNIDLPVSASSSLVDATTTTTTAIWTTLEALPYNIRSSAMPDLLLMKRLPDHQCWLGMGRGQYHQMPTWQTMTQMFDNRGWAVLFEINSCWNSPFCSPLDWYVDEGCPWSRFADQTRRLKTNSFLGHEESSHDFLAAIRPYINWCSISATPNQSNLVRTRVDMDALKTYTNTEP